MKRTTDSANSKRAFTLIELLVVVSIIGLMSSIVLASMKKARNRGIAAAQITTVKQLELALNLYRDDNGDFPPVAVGGVSSGGQTTFNNVYPAISKYMKNYNPATFPLSFYVHACSDTTLCSGAHIQNVIHLTSHCGSNYSSSSAFFTFSIIDGPSNVFPYTSSVLSDPNENYICLR